jgi:uncharacterized repeat protein (TIGR02543 family)
MKHKLLSVALITLLLCLVVGNSIGCTTPAIKYTLTIASTAGGNVTPAVGKYKYAAGTVVDLNAIPDSGYRFVKWTAPGFGSSTVAQNNWTMPAQDVTITAHFALGTLIDNVPDTSWPPTQTLVGITIPANFCAPLAMVNILGYWDEVMGNLTAQNVTAWLQPSNLNTVAEYVGYFMDTNNENPALFGNGLHAGTYAKDITPGNLDYVLWDAAHNFTTPPPAIPPGKLSHVWNGIDDYFNNPHPGVTGFPFIKAEIDAGRPLVICYQWWNLNMTSGINITDPQSGKVISALQWGTPTSYSSYPPEDWSGSGESCIGHAVTCVGYILNWDPDGGGPLPSGNWTIVHDTWGTTPENIAVPWTGAPWNSSHSVLP